MTGSSRQPLLGPIQKLLLVAVALGLAVTLLLVRGGLMHSIGKKIHERTRVQIHIVKQLQRFGST